MCNCACFSCKIDFIIRTCLVIDSLNLGTLTPTTYSETSPMVSVLLLVPCNANGKRGGLCWPQLPVHVLAGQNFFHSKVDMKMESKGRPKIVLKHIRIVWRSFCTEREIDRERS